MSVYEDIKTGLEQAIAYEKENNSKKAILVIDMPERCSDCPCFRYGVDNYCAVTGDTNYSHNNSKPDWCPLTPVPKKIDVPDWDNSIKAKNENAKKVGMYMYDRGHCRGYNACIDKILNT